ncbi:MAG: hypothetical protein JNL18_01595 [Planctomycetaceae bacterium]|nr:hypothetical protein [Planctomycetaceae bacterium]
MRASLRFLLFQLVPYVVLCAWLLTFENIHLRTGARVLAVVLITILWGIVGGSLIPNDGKVHRRGAVRPQDDR